MKELLNFREIYKSLDGLPNAEYDQKLKDLRDTLYKHNIANAAKVKWEHIIMWEAEFQRQVKENIISNR